MSSPRRRRRRPKPVRSVRRLAVLLVVPMGTVRLSATELDIYAAALELRDPRGWGLALVSAAHYLVEFGRNRRRTTALETAIRMRYKEALDARAEQQDVPVGTLV